MKVLVTGAGGQLGHDVMKELAGRGIECVGSGRFSDSKGTANRSVAMGMPLVNLDITDAEEVRGVLFREKPDAVIHCAAWTAVDSAEENPEMCRHVNAGGTANVARVCGELGIPIMYFSTDYVFDGEGTRPWRPEDPVNPIGVYGATKAEGEEAVREYARKWFILRIAWVFGLNGKNFVKTMLRLAQMRDTLRVVNDQIGTPTYTRDLARLVVDMILTDRYGVYHVTNEGDYISWYDFSKEIFRAAGITKMTVIPVSTEEYGAAAKRPANSRMDRSAIAENGFMPLPEWRDALRRYLEELREQGEI